MGSCWGAERECRPATWPPEAQPFGPIGTDVLLQVLRLAGGELWSALTCRAFRAVLGRTYTRPSDVAGSRERLKCARRLGCPFRVIQIARGAAALGCVDVLGTICVQANDPTVCRAAARARQWPTLAWAVRRGWMCDPPTVEHAAQCGAIQTVKSIEAFGYVRPAEFRLPTEYERVPDVWRYHGIASAKCEVLVPVPTGATSHRFSKLLRADVWSDLSIVGGRGTLRLLLFHMTHVVTAGTVVPCAGLPFSDVELEVELDAPATDGTAIAMSVWILDRVHREQARETWRAGSLVGHHGLCRHVGPDAGEDLYL